MKDIRTETRNAVPDTFTQLSSPHFDEFAIAAAQPVQPLPPPWKKRLLRYSLLLTGYLAFIVATVDVAFVSPPSSRADAPNEAMSSETQPDMQPGLAESPSATTTENEALPAPQIVRPKHHLRR